MVLLNTRFEINSKIEKAKKIELIGGIIKINNLENFKRIPINLYQLKEIKLPYVEINCDYGWKSRKIFSHGKYKVTYNQVDYFMSYLDELDLFTKVVLQQ